MPALLVPFLSTMTLIVSWNVAGLSTTANRIHDAYHQPSTTEDDAMKKPASIKKMQSLPSSSLAKYLQLHQIDICCLQEHKIPLAQLSSRSEPRGCSTVEGYESFWSCCVDKNRRGMNGVVTYVKQGMVKAANATPLGSPDLDEQGRCVMTDHGNFVIFNVYVPASGGQPLTYKMKFLNALRRAMKHQRDVENKAVILVGDLNIAHTALDVYWKDRVIHVQDILQEVQGGSSNPTLLPQWKHELVEAWPAIQAAMETKQVASTQTTNTLTKEKFDKFRLHVTAGNRKIFLGRHESTEEFCSYCYDFSAWSYADADTGDTVLAQEADTVSVRILVELMNKIAGVEWDEMTQRQLAQTDASVDRSSPTRRWLTQVVDEDSMVDAFRLFYPNAQARFTCWHQFTNRRYFNEGIRIDYTLVDRSLLQYVKRGDVPHLRCCGSMEKPDSEAAALCAATANGRYQPVSFEGEGIRSVSRDILDLQFGAPHTGMIYTPPSFSDHVAISLLMDDGFCCSNLELDEKDGPTRKAQPHKAQKSIASFFAKSSGNGNPPNANSNSQPSRMNGRLSLALRQQACSSLVSSARTSTVGGSKGTQTKRARPSPGNDKKAAKKPANSILNHFSQRK
jgi:exodeoxyribonuclease III